MPWEPPPPGPLPPLRRGGGDLNRASAGLAHSTTRAVREGGLWAVVAANSFAPAEPRPRCRTLRTSVALRRLRRSPRLPSPPTPLPQAGEGRIRLRVGWPGALEQREQSAKADFGPSLPRIHSPQQSRGLADDAEILGRASTAPAQSPAALTPGPSPASGRGGGGEFDRAPAGPAHSTVPAVREGGLCDVPDAVSTAGSRPGRTLPACAHPNPEVYPLSHAVCGRGSHACQRGGVRAPRQPRPRLP
jgi:hypothetical protein